MDDSIDMLQKRHHQGMREEVGENNQLGDGRYPSLKAKFQSSLRMSMPKSTSSSRLCCFVPQHSFSRRRCAQKHLVLDQYTPSGKRQFQPQQRAFQSPFQLLIVQDTGTLAECRQIVQKCKARRLERSDTSWQTRMPTPIGADGKDSGGRQHL